MFAFTALFTDSATRSVRSLSLGATFVVISQKFFVARHKSFGRATIAHHNMKHVLWRVIATRVAFFSRLDREMYKISARFESCFVLVF